MRFVLFTKTRWAEASRLRHQVAEMLVAAGHDVVFLEKCGPFFGRRRDSFRNGLRLSRHRELINHRLRIHPLLTKLNASYERIDLKRFKRLIGIRRQDVIINFNYDYYFIKDLFPDNFLLTILNDDVLYGNPLVRSEVSRTLALTASKSDLNFGVSHPLCDQLREFSDKVSLFLPWARRRYTRPRHFGGRDAILYWGFLNNRMHFDAVKHVLDSNIVIHFVGPKERSSKVRKLIEHKNARYHGERQLEAMASTVASCACSILPYNPHHIKGGRTSAITVNNRAFHILTFGLPLLYADLPALIQAPEGVIYPCSDGAQYVESFWNAQSRFEESQESISEFLVPHYAGNRLKQLMEEVPKP